MTKEYRYRAHIRWAQYVFPLFFTGIILVFWGYVALLGAVSWFRRSEPLAFLFLVLISVLVPALGLVTSYIFYRLAGVRVRLDEHAVVYRDRSGEQRVPFEDITTVCVNRPILYVGGWVKIVSRSGSIRLTVVVEGIGAFLQELKAALDRKGLSNRYHQAKFFRFLKTAEFSDQSWARLYSNYGELILISVAFVVVNAALGISLAAAIGISLSLAFLWGLVTYFWPPLVFRVVEITFMRRFARGADEGTFSCPPRDPAYEHKVYRKAVLWGGVVYYALSLVLWLLL